MQISLFGMNYHSKMSSMNKLHICTCIYMYIYMYILSIQCLSYIEVGQLSLSVCAYMYMYTCLQWVGTCTVQDDGWMACVSQREVSAQCYFANDVMTVKWSYICAPTCSYGGKHMPFANTIMHVYSTCIALQLRSGCLLNNNEDILVLKREVLLFCLRTDEHA